MSYIDKSLLPDEKIIFKTGKHLIIFYVPALFGLMSLGFYFAPHKLIQQIAFLPALLMLFTGFNQWLLYITAEFTITNRRIVLREGFFFRHINEMRLTTVSNMSINQSPLGQLLGYGTLIAAPFGGSNDIFTAISHPFEFQKAAQLQLDKLSQGNTLMGSDNMNEKNNP